ncbi:Hypothetical predicted protein [Podarcis lilfordi]|uniref:Uncharacterized protein n=1 Tax=Podarcis lilfordi TaxID=74358 RepID=A0AA35L386_9SAUR|nr:Hypothetical predicted protein [Podarcis lilfordi]
MLFDFPFPENCLKRRISTTIHFRFIFLQTLHSGAPIWEFFPPIIRLFKNRLMSFKRLGAAFLQSGARRS